MKSPSTSRTTFEASWQAHNGDAQMGDHGESQMHTTATHTYTPSRITNVHQMHTMATNTCTQSRFTHGHSHMDRCSKCSWQTSVDNFHGASWRFTNAHHGTLWRLTNARSIHTYMRMPVFILPKQTDPCDQRSRPNQDGSCS